MAIADPWQGIGRRDSVAGGGPGLPVVVFEQVRKQLTGLCRRGTRLADAAVAAALAPACLSCAEVLDRPTRSAVCDRCWRNLRLYVPPLCATCGAPGSSPAPGGLVPSPSRARCPGCDGIALPDGVTSLRAIGPYEGVLRDLVHALKYERRRSLAALLAPLLGIVAADVLCGADAVVPVPLHPWRQWQRGFNQAALLAAMLPSPQAPVLRRARATAPQADLDAGQRQANVRDAFVLAGRTALGRARSAARVRGRVLVLVDDVLTTGATLGACAGVLRRAGAREVRALTIARVYWA